MVDGITCDDVDCNNEMGKNAELQHKVFVIGNVKLLALLHNEVTIQTDNENKSSKKNILKIITKKVKQGFRDNT